MLKHIKRISLLLISIFMICVPVPADPAPLDEQVLVPTGPGDLCQDDERLLLAVPGYDYVLYYAYDEQGNCLGRFPATGLSMYPKIVRKDALFLSDQDPGELIRAGDLEKVSYYPPEDYCVLCLSRHYMTVEKKTGKVTLYDESTQPLGTAFVEFPFELDWSLSGQILDLPNTFFVRLASFENKVWIRFDKNGQEGQQIQDRSLLSYLDHKSMEVYSFGQYLVAAPYSSPAEAGLRGVVMTEDGTVVMDGIEGIATDYTSSLYLPYKFDEDKCKATAVVQDTGSAHMIYDSSLQSLGCLYEIPDHFSIQDGFVKGLAYQELNGNICEGFVNDIDTQTWIPYAREGGLLLICKNGTCLEIPAEGLPTEISSGYLVTTIDDGTRVYRLKDNCLAASYNRISLECLSLGTEGILLYDERDSESWWDSPVTIYDNAGNATYHSPDNNHYAFVKGTWTCRRGIYRGLIDMYGNWVLKDINNYVM